MKKSRFNMFIKWKGGHIIYNILNRSMLWVDKEAMEAIKNESFGCIPEEELEKLKRNGVVVEDGSDELQLAKSIYWASKFQGATLSITLLTTYECNMQCIYCYQGKAKPSLTMTREKANDVCEWLVKLLKEGNFKGLGLIFYGGEPLLNLPVISFVGETMRKLAPEVAIIVRINLDRENAPYIPQILKILEEEGLAQYVTVDIGQVTISDLNVGYSPWVFNDKEVEKSYISLLKNCLNTNFPDSGLDIGSSPTFCGAQYVNNFVIDPLGKIYKCWELLNREEFCLGDVEEGIDQSKHLQWLSFDPFQIETCRRCLYLPACGGGCKALSFFRFGDVEHSVCPWKKGVWKSILKRRVKFLHGDKVGRL